MFVTSCPRCRRECPILDSDRRLGDLYECYHCKVLGQPLRWYWETSRLWEEKELELNRISHVQVILGGTQDDS